MNHFPAEEDTLVPMPAFDILRNKVDAAIAARRAKWHTPPAATGAPRAVYDRYEFRSVNGINTLVAKYDKETMALMDAVKYHVADVQSAAAKFNKNPTDGNLEQLDLAVELFMSTIAAHTEDNDDDGEAGDDSVEGEPCEVSGEEPPESLVCAYYTGTVVHSDGDDTTTLDEDDIVELEGPDYSLEESGEHYSG